MIFQQVQDISDKILTTSILIIPTTCLNANILMYFDVSESKNDSKNVKSIERVIKKTGNA